MVAEDIHTHMLGTYVSLRRLIAVVTAGFLLTLWGYRLSGHEEVPRHSISAYYHHDNTGIRMKDVFVGALVTVGLLLVAYQGYTDRENWALNLGGVALLFVVFCPMEWPPNETIALGTVRETIHYASALVFFGSLAYVCMLRARDTLRFMHSETRKRVYRNLYRLTGALMIGLPLSAIGLYFLDEQSWVYTVEYLGVAVFLVYWLIKSAELEGTRLETEEKAPQLAAAPVKEKALRGPGGPRR